MEVNEILKLSGAPGRFAWILLMLCYINFFIVVFNDIFPGIYGATPDHHCRLPEGVLPNVSIPVGEDGQKDQCHVYVNYTEESGITQPCPDGWLYMTEGRESTVPTDWDLVCDRRYINSLSTSLYYVGIVIGALVFGYLSDRVGRRPVLLFCLFTPLGIGVLLYFVESLVVFVALRMLMGMLKQGLQINSFILAMEFFTSHDQFGVVAAVLETPWPVGGFILSLLSWWLEDWRLIQLVIVSPSIIALSYFWFIPESLRWQLSMQKYDAAFKNIKFVAKVNKVDIQDQIKSPQNLEELSRGEYGDESFENSEIKYIDLFRYTKMRRWTLILILVWFANSSTAYSIILGSHQLPVNRFLSLGIATLIDLPAILIVAFFSKRLKRRLLLSVSCALTGVFILATGFTPETAADGWLTLVFINTAKFATALTWTILNLITCEIYPTVMRTIGYGSCTFAARFGSILVPQILLLGYYIGFWLPMLILGILTLAAAALALFLPETQGLQLPNTVQEAEERESFTDTLNMFQPKDKTTKL